MTYSQDFHRKKVGFSIFKFRLSLMYHVSKHTVDFSGGAFLKSTLREDDSFSRCCPNLEKKLFFNEHFYI